MHGCFNLAHPDRAVLEAEVELAQQLVNEGLFVLEAPQPDAQGVVRVETPQGMKLSFSFAETDEVRNNLWGGLTKMWKPLDGRQVPVAKLREVRRGWRF